MMSSLEQSTATPLSPERQFEQDIATVLQTALAQHHADELGDAETLYRAILDAKADHPDVNYNLGVLLVQTRRPADAVPFFETALGVNPNQAQYWLAYVNALASAGQIAAAWLALELGQQRGLKGPAVNALIERMTQLPAAAPTPSAPIEALADAPQKAAPPAPTQTTSARAAQPESRVQAAVAKAPTPQDVSQFASLFNKGRVADAIRHAGTVTQRFPGHGTSWNMFGLALYSSGRYDEALAPLLKAAELLPEDVQCRTLLANVLNVKARHADAETVCRRIIEIQPSNAEAHRLLGTTLASQQRTADAVASCRRAVELAPMSGAMHCGLGVALLEDGRSPEAEPCFRRAIELDPTDQISRSNLLFCLTHKQDIDPATLLAEHRAFGAWCEDPERAQWPRHANSRDPTRRLQVGFVSGDLFKHAVTAFLVPVIKHLALDPSLMLHAYSNASREDEVTQGLRTQFAHWHMVEGMTDAVLADKIRADGIDILIDLSGHTGRNRLVAFARKPAPLQASWIGYPGTTGLHAVDYYITDRFILPPQLDDQFVERIARLPASAPFSAPDATPPVNVLPALHNGFVTFGSFNRLNKLSAEVIGLWSRLLHAVPNARMLVGAMPDASESPRTVVDWFAREGIHHQRLMFRPRAGVALYMQQHHQVDICLDTFPYAGGTTTRHALWMGVPTLTMPGDKMPSRAGVSALNHVGIEGFIAQDQNDFVDKGVYWVNNIAALAELRRGMRERCMQSSMFRPDVIAEALSRALRSVWQRWCDGLPAASFEVARQGEAVSAAADAS
ncbi:tetratricopeptide repeat protein [Paraburkholderia strydomiana]|uniref:O-linked N-acetylglucosamine transferase family protein n=1 Tax=Paraburkholderia strydomiana TaxID=1245417 RepID=UPI0038B8587D